ncbi:MAG: DUF1003 domain-containing protein [archaeon]
MKESVNGKKVDVHHMIHGHRTFGQKAADALTRYAGSWGFIIFFFCFILFWVSVNVWFFVKYSSGRPFDPYPFILLNLVLSCLAAIQAPVILMSQNREIQRDRNRAEYDYRVNVKAEKEIQEIQNQLNRIENKLNRK